jgi:hypothetical protein
MLKLHILNTRHGETATLTTSNSIYAENDVFDQTDMLKLAFVTTTHSSHDETNNLEDNTFQP